MMKEDKQRLTLDCPATYQIKVPGHLHENLSDWDWEMRVRVDYDDDSPPVSTLTVTVDQAALQGLLRRLYGLGLPVISVINVEIK